MKLLTIEADDLDTPLALMECSDCGLGFGVGDVIVHNPVMGHGHHAAHWICLNRQAAEQGLTPVGDQLADIQSTINARLEPFGDDRVSRNELLNAAFDGRYKKTGAEIVAEMKETMKELSA